MMISSRRRFLTACSAAGITSALLPGVLWAKWQEGGARRLTAAMLADALAISGLNFSDEEREQMLNGLNQNLKRYEELRTIAIDDTLAPPMYFSPLVPGTRLDRVSRPFRTTRPESLTRPSNLADVAFWPLTHLAELLRTRQLTSVELTRLYLERLHRYQPTLNCVVTFTDDLAMMQATDADMEIAAGRYRGPLHGVPWGCKDIIAVPGFKTTWGSGAFQDQTLATEATVVRLLREAGAVLVAKLTTGELAAGDRWFGGRTNNPWNPKEGSSGSSAGPAAATAAGLVAFAVGTETSGSILSPATVCGVTGLRPTFGRVSRFGAMTLSWTQDRLGPICRTAEDCAVVLQTIARPDENDLSVVDLPFNYDARTNLRRIKVGYFEAGFAVGDRDSDWRRNDQQALDEVRALGLTLQPFSLPTMPLNVLGGILGAESGAAFDEFLRTGRDKQLTSRARANGMRSSRLVPAVEYLQAQRVRALIMRQFAQVVSTFDVYIAPYMQMRGGEGSTTPGAAPPPPPISSTLPNPVRDHFQVANVCGYPAVSVPNGFTTDGVPTSITFLSRLYNEGAMLAVARAYQEKAGWHKKHPVLA